MERQSILERMAGSSRASEPQSFYAIRSRYEPILEKLEFLQIFPKSAKPAGRGKPLESTESSIRWASWRRSTSGAHSRWPSRRCRAKIILRHDWREFVAYRRSRAPPLDCRSNGIDPPQPDRAYILERLIRADCFEQVLQARYLGSKRFSLEGVTALIPLLDRVIAAAAEAGGEQVVIGMSHRGRLNVMAHIAGQRAADIFAGFEDVDPRKRAGQR